MGLTKTPVIEGKVTAVVRRCITGLSWEPLEVSM